MKLLERPEVRPHDSTVIEAPRREAPVRKVLPPAPKRGIRWMRWMAAFAVAVASVVTLTLVTGDDGPVAAYPMWDPASRDTTWIEQMRVDPLTEMYVPVEASFFGGYWNPYTMEWVPISSVNEALRAHPLTEVYVAEALSAGGYWNTTPYGMEWVPFES